MAKEKNRAKKVPASGGKKAHDEVHELGLAVEERHHTANVVVAEHIGLDAVGESVFILIVVHISHLKKMIDRDCISKRRCYLFLQNYEFCDI